MIALTVPLLASSAGATVTYTAVVSTGLQDPYQVAFNDGNMYIAGGDSDSVQEVTAAQLAGPAPYTPSTVSSTPTLRVSTLAFDAAGDLWFGDQFGGGVYEVTAAQLAGPTPVAPTRIFGVPSNANSIAFDSAGDLFVADEFHTIYEVAASQLQAVTPVVTLVANFTTINAESLVFESGNLWVSDANGGVDEVLASQLGGAVITSATNIISSADAVNPWGLAFDSSGNLFVVDISGSVLEVTSSQFQSGSAPYVPSTLATGFITPVDITVSPSGKLFVADYSAKVIDELDYVAPPSAPALAPVAGLSVSESSGSVSASWAIDANATSYTCTLMYGFSDPSTFSETSGATTCKFAVDSTTSWGVSVTANDSFGSSSATVAFGSAVVVPVVKKVTKKVTSIACTNGKHSKRYYGVHPKCPHGWRVK